MNISNPEPMLISLLLDAVIPIRLSVYLLLLRSTLSSYRVRLLSKDISRLLNRRHLLALFLF